MKNISRRSFLKTGAVAAAGLTIVPGSVLGKSFGYTAPSDKLNIAGIGVGGMGRRNLANMNTENIVALCDVDWHYADKTFKDYPKAKRFKDWRVMFDEMGKSIDAIMVATPDHTHAGVTAHAITLGKHCYTQKPLTHSVYESRLLTKLAKKYKVATQMGNQGNSFDWCRQIAEWIQSGVIGDVYEVHCWTDRPIWPQGLMKPNDTPKCPKTLDWDLWIGPAQKRPYNPVYTPWNWRGWWDFGTGALGDMACHIMDPLYWALDLKYPTSVIGSSTLSNLYSPPHAQIVTYTFPARPPKGNVKMPEVKVYWYDGGLMPPRPEELKDGQMMDTLNSGSHSIFDPKSKKTQNILVEVIFMSKTAKLKVNWGTKTQFSFRDTETDVPIKVGAHGEFEVQICNPRKAYLELIGAQKQFDINQLKERLAMRMMSKVEPAIARAMREKSLTYDRLSEHKDEIAQSVLPELSKMFEEDYGLKMFSFTLASVMIADEYVKAIETAKREKREREEEEAKLRAEKIEAAARDDKNWEKENASAFSSP